LQSFIEINNKINHLMLPMNWTIYKKNEKGFTLVELMVAVLLTGLAVIAIYRGYTSFSQSADTQEQIIEMQQNLRIGMYMIEKDIRRTGMEEGEDEFAGFEDAEESSVTFNMDLWGDDGSSAEDFATLDALDGTTDGVIEDLSGDGDVADEGERLTYKLEDNDGDGLLDLVVTDENGAVDRIIITGVDALNIVYLDVDEGDTIDPDATPNDPATGRLPGGVAAGDLDDIFSVQIAIVVRTTNEDYRYTNNEEYRNLQNSVIYKAPGDNFRRRMIVKQIKIRNAGL
jgi:prepilin-type N-terminal cleavage/methylation domain-containing protein